MARRAKRWNEILEIERLRAEIERMRADAEKIANTSLHQRADLMAENERLTLENWQLKGALGYAVPGHIPEGDFKCGLCDANAKGYFT